MKNFLRNNLFNKLNIKIIAVITIILLISIFTLSFVINNTVYNEISNIAQDRNLQGARYVQSEVNNFLLRSKEIIDVLSENGTVVDGDYNEKLEEFAYIHSEYNQFKSVYFASTEGVMYLYPEEELPAGFDPRARPWYQDAVQAREQVWTEVYQDAASGELIISTAKPIYINNQLQGVMAADISLDFLSELVSNITVGESGYAYIVDGQGRILAHPDTSLIEDRFDVNNVFDYNALRESGNRSLEYEYQEEEILVSYEELIEIDGAAFVATPIEETYQASYIISGIVLFGSFIMLLFVSLAIFLSIRYLVTKPINKSLEFANSIAAGKLNIEDIQHKSKDEIGQLNKALNKMRMNLHNMIGQVAELSEQVAASSEELSASGEEVGIIADQVSHSIQNVASGAEEQSAQIEETSNTIKNLSTHMNNIAQRFKEVTDSASNMMTSIQDGNKSVSDSVIMINKVEEDSIEVASVIQELGKRSTEIGNIIDLINGIAAQTNLLALNAAIEAARAGEAGRGFSVVADEIRDLATESAGATDKISNIIKEIQSNVSVAIDKMEKSRDSVKQGVGVIKDTGGAFKEIKRVATTLEDVLLEVENSSIQINKNSEEVEKAINDIAAVSQEFAGSSQEVAASSEEQIASTEEIISSARQLSDMAEKLSNAVNKFDI
ncbi:methyl-accepting chemotaxis protein [Natronospora cellulosivora (SeqCode)]